MGFARIQGPLTSRKGQRVRFGAPKDVSQRGGGAIWGTIIDEVWAHPEVNLKPSRKQNKEHDWGDYSFFSQLIRWDEGGYSIRLGYYRRRAGEDWWEFASQTTVVSEWETIKSLFEQTLMKKRWFCEAPEKQESKAVASGSN